VTPTDGGAEFPLSAGAYRAVVETQDRFGKKVTGKLLLQVLNPNDTKLRSGSRTNWPSLRPRCNPARVPGPLGTGYDQGRAFVELEHQNK